MFFVRQPSDKEISDLIAAQSRLPFSYSEIGATRNHALPGDYPINYLRRELGQGREIYAKATGALRAWQMYALDYTKIYPPSAPIKEGEMVAVLVKHLGFWSLNPCRIVYSFAEETEEIIRSGFAFGTLPVHSETGEERFTVEWNRETDAVWYELRTFARAHHWLAKLGFPFVRLMQKRFASDSHEAMLAAVKR